MKSNEDSVCYAALTYVCNTVDTVAGIDEALYREKHKVESKNESSPPSANNAHNYAKQTKKLTNKQRQKTATDSAVSNSRS